MEFLAKAWNLFERTVLRIVLSALVIYLFIVVLMTASAQQRVGALLEGREGAARIDYSSAWAMVQDAERQQRELAELTTRRRALDREEQAARSSLRDAEAAANEAWNRFSPVATRVMALEDCAQSREPDRASVWSWVIQCQQTASLPPRVTAQLTAAISADPNFEQADRDLAAARRKVETLGVSVTSLASEIEKAEKASADAQSLRAAFNEMNVLRGSWLLGAGIMVPFPPTLMQFILAFSAGMFGALLITLVLSVYPKHEFSFAASEGFKNRILLGGMISLCVYIVLGGGSAILGTADPFSGGQANVMTFSAVGVLAGMFSDKVAVWLAARADVLFRGDEPPPPKP